MFRGLEQDQYDRQYSDTYLIRRLISYFAPHKRRIVILTVMGLIVAVAQALTPILVSEGINLLEIDAPDETVVTLIAALFITGVIIYVANWLRRRATNRVVADLMRRLRKDGFEAAVNRDMAFYDANKTGKLLSRLTSDTEEFGQVMLLGSDIVARVVQVMILTVVLLSYDLELTLAIFLFILPMIGVTMVFRRWARYVTRQGARAMANVNDNIQETVTGIGVAKNFRQEQMIYEAFEEVNNQSYRINLQRGIVLSLVFPVLNALGGFGTGAMAYFGALAVVGGTIEVSIWYLYIQSVDRFWFPAIQIASYWNQFQQAMSAIERVFALIDAENTVQQIDDQPAPRFDGKIEIEDVNFAYKPDERVLDHFNLSITPGENIAFVGHTGAGKSTISKLIMRMYEFQHGSVRLDGHDIRSFDLQSYRAQLGFVPQAPFLFSGTVMDNIRYGRPDADDAEIEALAHSIGEGEWIETLPEGLQSDVGERGAMLSIGQRQLVSLLRVLIQKPAVFILDEATASIDQFTESQIQEALEMILSRSTSILIAHRLSTIRSADRIIVLREGEIIEEGNHKQLMAQGGHYAELYNTYFRHQSLDYVEQAQAMRQEVTAARAD